MHQYSNLSENSPFVVAGHRDTHFRFLQDIRMKDIILPQALRNILPALVNELINLIKESALISIIGGMDIMRRAQAVSAETYAYFTPMLTAAATYYIMVMIVSTFAKILERRLAL